VLSQRADEFVGVGEEREMAAVDGMNGLACARISST
jgi:hypothetical protein